MLQIQHFSASNGVLAAKKWHAKEKKESFITTPKAKKELLENYLTTLGNQNLALVSFGSNLVAGKYRPINSIKTTPYDANFDIEAFRPSISDYAKWKIRTEATNKIYGKNKWPNIKDIEGWFITAETQKFMAIGGLAQVAADLPNSFNKKFANDNRNNMRCITPIYTYKDNMGVVEKNGQKYYQYGQYIDAKTNETKPNLTPIEKLGELNIPIYNPNTNTKFLETCVEIYKGYEYDSAKPGEEPNNDGTEYIFLHTPNTRIDENGNKVPNAQIFNTEAMDPNSEGNKTPYAYSKFNTDELTRMAFLSKTVYELIKEVKSGNFRNLKAPNILFLNDWHAGPLAALVKYQANAETDVGTIPPSLGKYFDTLPTLYIAHNVDHQGSTCGDADKRTSVFATLFGEHGADIVKNARSWRNNDDTRYDPKQQDRNALFRYSDFNSAVTGMMLADRVIPVSVNYGEELLHSENKARGFKDLFNARAFSPFTKTFTPITNGYTKALIEPNKKHMDGILKQAEKDLTLKNEKQFKLDDIKLKPFENGEIENKIHNKNEVMKIINRLIERERELSNTDKHKTRRYFMHDPKNTEIPVLDDYSKTPIVTFVGRFDPQKGLNNILKDALWKFAEENKDKKANELPIFIIGGKITQQSSYDSIRKMKDEMKAKGGIYKELAKRIILFKGYVNTNLLATAADLFLVPSVFEPCGLTQMEAMAKGALPVATSTGGLVDTIDDGVDGFRTKAFFDQDGWETKERIYGKGFKTNADAYCECLTRALNTFKNDKEKFEQMQRNAIEKDFSWNAPGGAVDKYISLIRTGKISA